MRKFIMLTLILFNAHVCFAKGCLDNYSDSINLAYLTFAKESAFCDSANNSILCQAEVNAHLLSSINQADVALCICNPIFC